MSAVQGEELAVLAEEGDGARRRPVLVVVDDGGTARSRRSTSAAPGEMVGDEHAHGDGEDGHRHPGEGRPSASIEMTPCPRRPASTDSRAASTRAALRRHRDPA